MAGSFPFRIMNEQRHRFVVESNHIEGIDREPTPEELIECDRFMALEVVTVPEMERFVSVYQSGIKLRDKPGMNVRVAKYIPPLGGPEIRKRLEGLLKGCGKLGPHRTHVEYELIHPFMDGNGRSGRMLWAWQMRFFPLGFLHHFYYQTLAAGEAI